MAMVVETVKAFPWSKVPWKELVVLAGSLITTASKQRKEARAVPKISSSLVEDGMKSQLSATISRLDDLEIQNQQQAVLIENLAQQVQRLTYASSILSKRLTIIAGVAAVAVFVSIALAVARLF
jgi:uncharacterized coiled-coil protein SlyX